MKPIAIAAALFLTGFTGLQAATAPLTEILKLFDLDRDGALNEEERPAARKAIQMGRADFIALWDANKDGRLSLDEIRILRRALINRIMERRRSIFLEFAGEDRLMSQAEFADMPIFADKDPIWIEEIFQRLDRDENGSLSFLEFNARFRQYRI